jgi:hypothetical protein
VQKSAYIPRNKRITGLILVVAIFFSLYAPTIQAQAAANVNIQSSGFIIIPSPSPTPSPTPIPSPTQVPTPSPTATPSPNNLAVIPNDWSLSFGSNPQYAFLDYDVTYNGHVSIRIGPDYVGATREIDGKWYTVRPGDHIVAKVWILVGDSSTGDTISWHGGRLGFDLYAHTSAGYGIIDSYPHDGQEHINSVVKWGTNVWIQKVWDLTIPSTYYTQMHTGNLVWKTCNPIQIDSIVLWLDVRQTTDAGLAWFSDAEFYINP